MKKGLFILLFLLMCTIGITGCDKRKSDGTTSDTNEQSLPLETTEEQEKAPTVTQAPSTDTSSTDASSTDTTTNSTNTEDEKTKELLIFYGDEQAEYILSKTVKVKEITNEEIVKQLIECNILPEGTKVNRITEKTKNGKKAIIVDFSKEFSERLGQMGTSGEFIVMGSVVNTFLSAYNCEYIKITVDGNTTESGHATYDEYMKHYDNDAEWYITKTLLIEGESQEVELLKIYNELGFSIAYDNNILKYDYDKENKVASFIADNPNPDKLPNVFLSVNKSSYNVKDTIEGLKLQAFTDNIKTSEVKISENDYLATLIEMRGGNKQNSRIAKFYVLEQNSSVYIIEIDYYVEAEEGHGARLDMMLDTIRFVK